MGAIGNRVRELRKAKGLTQMELSALTGLAHGFISEVEAGKKTPSVWNAQRLAEALGVTVEEAFPPQDREPVQSEVIRS